MDVLSQTTMLLMLIAYIAGLVTAMMLLSSRSWGHRSVGSKQALGCRTVQRSYCETLRGYRRPRHWQHSRSSMPRQWKMTQAEADLEARCTSPGNVGIDSIQSHDSSKTYGNAARSV